MDKPYFSFSTFTMENVPETEETPMTLCDHCSTYHPSELVHKMECGVIHKYPFNVCESCFPEYYKSLVEAEDIEGINFYHGFVLRNPSLLLI